MNIDEIVKAIRACSSLNDRHLAVFSTLAKRPLTKAELTETLNFKMKSNRPDLLAMHALDALKAHGLVRCSNRRRICSVSGKNASEWEITRELPHDPKPARASALADDLPTAAELRRTKRYVEELHRALSCFKTPPQPPKSLKKLFTWIDNGCPGLK